MNLYVSFVIPALNEAQYIAAALASIHRAMENQQAGYEVIVVDDDSQDSTVEIAREHFANVVRIHERNIAAVRNAGARQARGDLLIFVDADTQASPALVHEVFAAFKGGATWGTALAIPADRCPLWARLGSAAFNYFYVRWRQCAYGFFFFVSKEAFEQIGGFPERSLEGEDSALSKSLYLRHGPPAVIQSRVATSARKARQFGFWYHLKMIWLTVRYGDNAYSRPEIQDYRDGSLRMH